ncbi:MAG TPA: Rv3654c family TadE-like protein [Nocardioidaceae bacterium]|nr:Rv3654c family TadE-like protein [Nocardioidaceae bacterium]
MSCRSAAVRLRWQARPPGCRWVRSRRSSRGSATVLAVVMLLVLGLAGALAAGLGGVLVAKRRAASAADLTALAGAAAVQRGDPGCAAAAAVAQANGARLVTCDVHAEVVEVAVSVPVHALGITDVQDRAKAGPG